MKKLLYILLLLPALAWGQTTSVTPQFRRNTTQVDDKDSLIYTFPGIMPNTPTVYRTFWNATMIRGYVATHLGPTYTFINGLQNYGGNNIGLGGSIDGFASIDLTDGSSFAMQSPQANFSLGHDLRFGQGLSNISQIVLSDDNATFALNSATTNEQQSIIAIPGLITMSYVKAGTSLAANISLGNTTQPIVFTDHIANAGPVAGGNYEANYISKSYTSKRYVDSVAVAGTINPDSVLHPNKNLYDIPNKTTARLNLGVYSKDHIDSLGVINKNNSAKYWTKLAAGSSVIINQFGTSLTYGQNSPGGPVAPINGATQTRALYQAPSALQQTLILAGISATVNNKGFPGDDVASGITRWDTCAPVDVAIVEYGTNDALNYGGHGVSPIDTFRNRYIRFIEKRINQGSWVILTLPTNTTNQTKNILLDKYRSVIQELAGLYNCPLINVQQINEWQNNFYFDEVHLSALGYNEWGVNEAAFLIKPESSIPKVYNGQSFNPYTSITNTPYTTNTSSTSGRAWAITASTYYPVVINMQGTSLLSTKGIQPAGSSTYYMQYGNGINQKTDTLTTASTLPTYNRGGILVNPGYRVMFIHGSGAPSYIDQINFEGNQVYSSVSKNIIGKYSVSRSNLIDKGASAIQDTTKTTSGIDYNGLYSKIIINPTASSTQRSIGIQSNLEKTGSFNQTGGLGNNALSAVSSNTGSGNIDVFRGVTSNVVNISSGLIDRFNHFYAYSPATGTANGIRSAYGVLLEAQKTAQTSFGYGLVSRGTADRSIIGGNLAIAGGVAGLDTGYVNANTYSLLVGNHILPLSNGNVNLGLNTLAWGNVWSSTYTGPSSADLKLTSQSTNGISLYTGSTSTQVQKVFGATGNTLIQTGGTFTDAGFKLDLQGTFRVTGNSTFGGQVQTNTLRPVSSNLVLANSSNAIVGTLFNTTGNLLLQNAGTQTDNGQKLQVTGRAAITQASTGVLGLDSILVHDNTSKEIKVISANVLSFISGTPTIVAGAGAGTSPTVSVTSNSHGLQVTVTTGTIPTGTNAVIATVTLPVSVGYTPYPVFSSANAATSLLNGASMIYMASSSGTNVTITSGTTALVASTTYIWNIQL